MFVQLRRVVYLLVLLQCCACVACAESPKEVTVTLQNTVTAEEETLNTKMNEKLQEFNMTAEQLLANGSFAFSVLDVNVQTLQSLSEGVEFVAEKTEELVENRSKPVIPVSEDTSDEDTTEDTMWDVKGIIKSAAETAEIVKLAISYCKYWSNILDKLIAYCGKPAGGHISGESEENLNVEPQTTYEELYLLKAYISAATKRGSDYVKKVEQDEKAIEVALNSHKVLNNSLKDEIKKIRDDAKKNSMTTFEKILTYNEVDTTVFLKLAKEHEETADQRRNEDQQGEDNVIAKKGSLPPPASQPEGQAATKSHAAAEPELQAELSAPQSTEQSSAPAAPQTATEDQPPAAPEPATKPQAEPHEEGHDEAETATVEHAPAEQAPQAQSSAPEESSSLESPERPTADVPKEQTANTAETGNSDAATPTPTPTAAPTTTTTAAALIEANKKGLQNAASGPMSSTAVLAVLALTVSTVIGMTVV